MTLRLYNTLTRRKEAFEPLKPGEVGFYVCGPTVYDYAHIGNARPVVAFDVLYRVLRRLYPSVTYVRNITDVEDKIIDACRKSGEAIDSLTERTAAQFHADMDALGALRPDVEPRATQHIANMVAMIETLVRTGHAYEAEGHVLFHVPAMADYGRLSRRPRDEQVAGARVEVAPYKRDPADFVLWKPSTGDEPGWESPWGKGRPGWHIECSAMSEAHLGETFDIHGGGLDLIFPHHENEIAQSTCAHGGAALARYWVHNGYVMVNGEKMSKSLGNFVTVNQLRDEWPGEVIRLTLLSAHYRQPLDFTDEGLRRSRQTLDRLYTALRHAGDVDVPDVPMPSAADLESGPVATVWAALLDDLNTPLALAGLHDLASDLNKSEGPDAKARAKAALLDAGALLGLLQGDAEAWFTGGVDDETSPGGLTAEAIEQLIAERQAARKAKDFAKADKIRDDLAANGIVLEDGPNGTSWRRAV